MSAVIMQASQFNGVLLHMVTILDTILTTIGLIPEGALSATGAEGIQTAADGIGLIINMILQDPLGIILSIFAIVPVVGLVSGPIKILYKIVKLLEIFFSSS